MIHRLLAQTGACRSSSEALRNKRRVVKLITIVITTFAGSWLPLQTILLCKALDLYPFSVTNISFQIGSHVLAYSNSCVNPILYAYFSSPFREAFIKLFFKKASNGRLEPAAVTLVMATVGEQKKSGGFAIGVGFQVQKGDRRQLKKEEQLLSDREEKIGNGSEELLPEGEVRDRPEQVVRTTTNVN